MVSKLFGYIQVEQVSCEKESELDIIVGKAKDEAVIWSVVHPGDNDVERGQKLILLPYANPVKTKILGVPHIFIKVSDILAFIGGNNEN